MTTAETLDARDARKANALADVKNFILWCELWLLNVERWMQDHKEI